MPQESDALRMNGTSGPGESGFTYIEQKTLVPKETLESEEKKKE